jgi:hypothetical protein
LHDVQPIQGQAPQHEDRLDQAVDSIHRAAHKWFTRDKSQE